MNKEFIPYELQKELYELGFNDKTTGVIVYKKEGVNEFSFVSEDFPTEWMSGVLYQQAFRWFREKYGLYSAVNVDQTMEPKFAYCISKYWTDALSWGWDTIIFNSDLYYNYEEAELACLKKLIEIVKNK
jgi:hypothetical protein